MSASGKARRQPLEQYDPNLAMRLKSLLVDVLGQELGKDRAQAAALADEVVWSVSEEADGAWMNMSYRQTDSGVGGDWTRDEEGLTLYVRQMAYDLVGRERDFEP